MGIRLVVESEDSQTEWPELMVYQKTWVLFGVVDLKEKNSVEIDEINRFRRVNIISFPFLSIFKRKLKMKNAAL